MEGKKNNMFNVLTFLQVFSLCGLGDMRPVAAGKGPQV